MQYEFRWNAWNVAHIAEHGVDPKSAEYLVNHAGRGFPRLHGDGKLYVAGQDENGRYLQVIFVLDPDDTAYVIHARPLEEREKRRLRRWRRR